ncbi:MAG: VWA domain-containing protein [Nannocystis sp.]|nr:hypothetical protein [Nannocystis sp.]MBA3544907.1 VWA domain-containing protein [Nannocystis sp.]
MPFLRRLALPLVILVPACGTEGGDGSASNSATGTATSVTSASATDAGTSTGAGSASESASEATADGTGTGGASQASQTGETSEPTGTGDASTSTSASTSTTGGVDPGTSSGGADTFEGTGDDMCKMQIDIVFVMDVSTSMLALLQKLEDEILTVDTKLKSLDVLPDIHYGLVVFVDDTLIINGGAPYADVQALKMDFNKWWKFTQSNSQVNGGGSNGDWPENSIDALFTAAGAFQWRPMEDTLRMVIHCTDDTFGVKGAVQSGVAIQHTYEETVLALQDRQVRVFAFTDDDKTGGPGNNEDVSMGFFTPYNGQTPIPDATDGGAFNINLVLANQLSLNAAINDSVSNSLCQDYIPQ